MIEIKHKILLTLVHTFNFSATYEYSYIQANNINVIRTLQFEKFYKIK